MFCSRRLAIFLREFSSTYFVDICGVFADTKKWSNVSSNLVDHLASFVEHFDVEQFVEDIWPGQTRCAGSLAGYRWLAYRPAGSVAACLADCAALADWLTG